jgi:cAMP-specific phosphodiesterase 4
MLAFDAIVIIASIALVVLELYVDYGRTFSSVSSIVRGIFRFLRIFLLMRKVSL